MLGSLNRISSLEEAEGEEDFGEVSRTFGKSEALYKWVRSRLCLYCMARTTNHL